MKFKNPKHKAIFKTITWRIIASTTTFILAQVFGLSLEKAIYVAVTEFFLKMVFYYYHERAWDKVATDEVGSEITKVRRAMQRRRTEFCMKNWERILGVDKKGNHKPVNQEILLKEAREFIGYSDAYSDGDMMGSLRIKAHDFGGFAHDIMTNSMIDGSES